MPATWRPYLEYRARLTSRARALRRDPTPAERKLWYEFLRDLPQKFTRQKPIGRYVTDFYCAGLRLAIELDGDSHYLDGAQERDAIRSSELARQGIRVVRFTNAEVLHQFEATCLEIRRVIESAGG